MDPFLYPTVFSNSDSSSSSSTTTTTTNFIDPLFSGISLQTLLSLNPSLFYPSLSSLTDHPPPPPPLPPIKTEHPYQMTHLPFNFHHSPIPKRPRFNYSPAAATSPRNAPPPPPLPSSSSSSIHIPQSNLARQRRQKLSEKTRCLQKLMPWDKKMDQATLLEEAYKYVKFLQAQLTVLQTMPSSSSASYDTSASSSSSSSSSSSYGGVFGDLERLNRNQVLQVLVNSPVAQSVMCSQGFCVFSMEQFVMLRKFSERRILLQQVMISDHHSSLNNNDDDNNTSY
ncbi:hypothetical protein RIF29_27347 [Crotalaria pallida]|uniref:BHLH domain-containing protein n=1 Tax=Crotalaria pallida TaxID=3830 RepID=A0AAN9ENX4_CROPI